MGISDIQKINIRILNELRRVCMENNIQYFLDSGTLIGAVRGNDFIPWDDDVDIVILRRDFEKLRSLPPDIWNNGFRFVNYDGFGNDVFFDTQAHLFCIDEKVEFEKSAMSKIKDVCNPELLNCVSIDIFVLDYTYHLKIFHDLRAVHYFFLYGLMLGHRDDINYADYPGFSQLVVFVLSKIGRHISLKKIFDRYERFCKIKKNGTHYFYSNISLFKAVFKHLECRWWDDGAVICEFHGDNYMIPKRYHDILTYEYGDYMTPPKVKDQVPAHFLGEE